MTNPFETALIRYDIAETELSEALLRKNGAAVLADERLAIPGKSYIQTEDIETDTRFRHGIDLVAEDGSATRVLLGRDDPTTGYYNIRAVFPDGSGGALALLDHTIYAEDFSSTSTLSLYRIGPDGTMAQPAVTLWDSSTDTRFVNRIDQAPDGTILLGMVERTTPHLWGSLTATVKQVAPDGSAAGPDLTLYTDVIGGRLHDIAVLADGSIAFTYGEDAYQPQGDFPIYGMVGAVSRDGTPLFDSVRVSEGTVSTFNGLSLSPLQAGPDGGLYVFTEDEGSAAQFIEADGTLGATATFNSEHRLDLIGRHALPDGTFAEIISATRAGNASIYYIQTLDSDGEALSPREAIVTYRGLRLGSWLNEDGQIVMYEPLTSLQIRHPDSPVRFSALAEITPVSIERLTDGDDIRTLQAPGAVDAGAGNDTLTGSEGDDRLIAGSGDDLVLAGDGDDRIEVSGRDTVDGGGGFDTVVMRNVDAQDWDIAFQEDRSVLFVTRGVEARLDNIESVQINFSDLFSSPITRSIEMIEHGATEGDNVLRADASGQHMDGGAGSDQLFGGLGDDTLNGGTGRDTLVGDDGDDLLLGGPEQGDAMDFIYGGLGNDTAFGGWGNDRIWGMEGDDLLSGGFGGDILAGQDGNDSLAGGALGDELHGNAGDDFLNGGFGFDRLNGGAGADEFFHLGIADHGADWIQDYTAADGDVLLWGGGAAQAGDFLIQRANTPNAGLDTVEEVFITYLPSQTLVWALVDGDAQDSLMITAAGQTFDLLI